MALVHGINVLTNIHFINKFLLISESMSQQINLRQITCKLASDHSKIL